MVRIPKRQYPVNGVVIYRGPSLLDGRRIVVVVTGIYRRSRNTKTGDMLQSWVLRERIDPVSAVALGRDESVCGQCPHRPALGGSCYVNVGKAPLAIYRAFKAGAYPTYDPAQHARLFRGRKLRVGSYGDPAAVPLDVWLLVLGLVESNTGYTHQWRDCEPGWKQWLMASCDSPAEREQAQATGWRTFRVRSKGAALLQGEFSCPASEEAGYRTSCERCLACHGQTDSGRGASPSIEVHGATAGRFALDLV